MQFFVTVFFVQVAWIARASSYRRDELTLLYPLSIKLVKALD